MVKAENLIPDIGAVALKELSTSRPKTTIELRAVWKHCMIEIEFDVVWVPAGALPFRRVFHSLAVCQ